MAVRRGLQVPLNRDRVSDVGARVVMADWEWFIPLGDPSEQFASRQRVRAGLGYRQSKVWRFDARYIWNRSRDTTQDAYTTSDHIISLGVVRSTGR